MTKNMPITIPIIMPCSKSVVIIAPTVMTSSAAVAAPHGRPAPVGAEAFSLYSLTHLLELGATVAVGIGFFFLATRTRVGERLLRRIRATRAGLNTALALVVLGFVVLAAINWLL